MSKYCISLLAVSINKFKTDLGFFLRKPVKPKNLFFVNPVQQLKVLLQLAITSPGYSWLVFARSCELGSQS